ncbi:4'-phosphopantetheinyl transferase family protein [Tahibacter caeni]|uniref:4'-phosphopantetheinyl transferase family protein n=1 Tax=Tahibacter caeni TaxID=1453545 RepID=UPI002147C2B6|nr:4'-phosphopantetheinyl transferase superfamily protein [Tahibacter caeni]
MKADLAVADGVDVWLAFYNEITDAALLEHFSSLLSRAEREQEARFHFADDRRRYRVTRALQRTVLSRYAPVAPTDWSFATNDYGCPRVAATHAAAAGLSFNLSHTRGLIALAVTRDRAVGVDVENLAVREVAVGIADRFFAPVEVEALAAVPAAQQQHRFFEYWTFKEAYIKARGMGLSLPLDKFSFRFPEQGAVQLAVDAELGDDAGRWRFAQYRPTPEHLLALCVEHGGPLRAPPVRLRKVVPAVGHEDLELEPLKMTL